MFPVSTYTYGFSVCSFYDGFIITDSEIMAAICKLVELIVSLCMIVFISVSQSVLQSDDIYHITKNPDLPSDYANEADSSYSGI